MKKEVFITGIIENTPIAEGVFRMEMEYPEAFCQRVVPGQFVNLYLNRKDLLLPRPISICRVEKGRVVLVYRVAGAGTKELAGYSAGTSLRISSPLGNGYDLSALDSQEPGGEAFGRDSRSALVTGGGIGIPPLLELTHRLKAMNVMVDAVLGFRDEPFLLEEFKIAGARVHVATDSGRLGFKGRVPELIKARQFMEGALAVPSHSLCFACGPMPMLKALTAYCVDIGLEIQVSLEERMGCGFGACVGCVCKVKTTEGTGQKKVCKDGPVFSGKEVVWDA